MEQCCASFLLKFVLMALCFVGVRSSISCMDASGQPVDWFIVYKLPHDKSSSNPLIRDGVAHMYLDVNSQSFVFSKVSLNDSNQAVAYTLQQIYDNDQSQDVMYMMYNDEFPDGQKSFENGHTKGDIATDEDTGFWLIHSVPKFPDFAKGQYHWPSNAEYYGQSMLCISMKTSEIAKIGKQLLYNYPYIFDYNIPSSFQSQAQFSDFVSVAKNGTHVKTSPFNHTVLLTSLAGQQFKSFAKATEFNEDLYWYWVAPALGDALYVESWMNGASKLPSFCNGSYDVENVASISFGDVMGFKETQDHSKWAITETKSWACIGDINRMESQYQRAGGTVCAQISGVWKAFKAAISGIDKCPSTTRV